MRVMMETKKQKVESGRGKKKNILRRLGIIAGRKNQEPKSEGGPKSTSNSSQARSHMRLRNLYRLCCRGLPRVLL